jgi:hypothetical protein
LASSVLLVTDLTTAVIHIDLDFPGNSEGFSVFHEPPEPKNSKLTKLLISTKEIMDMFGAHYAIQLKVPFSVACSPWVPRIAATLGFAYPAPSPQTIGQCVFKLFGNASARLHDTFSQDVLRGCFTYDGWKRHSRKFIGITFHYLDKTTYKPKSVAIGFEEYFDSGGADDIQEIIG